MAMTRDEIGRTDFPSKRDTWLAVVLWITAGVFLAKGLLQLEAGTSLGGNVTLLLATWAGAAFVLWILYGTRYRFSRETLDVRSGPFRFKVPLAQVVSAEPSRNPLSSPACSLDRLLIRYGRRRILISPVDRAEFLEELARRGSDLVREGDRVVRKGS